MEIRYEDIVKANETIKTTDIKGKEYAEVNQRIKAFRMIYPNGAILTDLIKLEDGMCVFKAEIRNEEGDLISTGTAYEKENSTFINKTSYIENCETSAVGRALGMAGFGIDASLASADEVINAIENQTMTLEEAKNYVLNFGKHKGKKLTEVPEDYLAWLYGAEKTDEVIKKAIDLLNQEKASDELTPYDFMSDEEKLKAQPIDNARAQQLKMNLTKEEVIEALKKRKKSKVSELTLGEALEILDAKDKAKEKEIKEKEEVF